MNSTEVVHADSTEAAFQKGAPPPRQSRRAIQCTAPSAWTPLQGQERND
jgi:hypothetical protein